MEPQECVVCGVVLQPEDPRIFILNGVTEHTSTPLREVVGSALQQRLKTYDFICMKCSELFNEKDRLQKMTTDMDSRIMTKIKDSSKKVNDIPGTISVVMGESLSSESIKEELERQYKNIKANGIDSKSVVKTEENAEPSNIVPKRRRGRPPKVTKKKKTEDIVVEAPPLMVNEREKRKRSEKFNTFLEVLKGEKDFYIEGEDVEEPKSKKRGGGRKKKSVNLGIVPVEDKTRDDDMDKMCIIQVTDLDMQGREVHTNEKDRLDLDEVVQEIFGIAGDAESSLIQDIENFEHEGKDLINVIDEMNSQHEERSNNNSNQKEIVDLPNHKLEIKEEAIEIDTSWCDIKQEKKSSFEDLRTPSIEIAEIEEDLAASMPSLEVTITQSEDNTVRAVINDPDVLSAIVQEDSTDLIETAIKQEKCSSTVVSEQKKYRCKLCNEIFYCKDAARKHAQESHAETDLRENDKSNEESFKCSDCDRTFPTLRGRDRHYLHMHLKRKPVQCTECLRTFNSFHPLERHLSIFHDKDPTLFCEICEAEFVLGTSLEHHKEIMHPVASRNKLIRVPASSKIREQVKQNRLFECPFCNQEIFGARALRLHHQKMHNGQGYTCKYCKYKSTCLSTMRRHMVRVHKALNLKLYNCLKCMAGYQDPRDLEEHYVSVHKAETSFLCQHCGEKFACIDMLRFHRNSHRAFSCKLCHLGFMKEEALEDHMKAVHTCDPVAVENGDATSQSENESVCEKLGQPDEDIDGDSKVDCGTAVSSKILVIASDGTVQVKDEGKEASAIPAIPSEDVTLHLQQTREGGLEEMDMLNPLKGQRVKDLPKKMNCPVCNKVLTTKFLRTHMLSHKGKLPHKCHMCDKAYAQGTLLRKHMKNRHYEEYLKLGNKNPKKHKIGCDFCQEIYDNIYALEEHLWLHMDEKTFECTDCKIKFGMATNLREHYKSHFFKEARPCPVCKREFKSIGFFNEHVEKCQKRWKCEQCGLECDTQEYYRKHQRSEHGSENVIRYQCTLCEKSFVERHRYDDHMITHSSEKAFPCHICEKQFKRQRPLKDHLIRAHSEGRSVCSYCRKTFPSQQELDLHKQKHRKEFPCTPCGHTYTSKEALTNHLMVHHSESSHSCHICGQSFVKQVNLKAHIITHSSNTPNICHADGCHKMFRSEALLRNHVARRHHELQYECPICDRKFGLESDQIRHMATHSNATALPCAECGRTFRSEAQLERHLLTHTQEKPYECGVCQHTTATRHQLLRHVQGEHGFTDAAPHLVVNRWRCSVCGKMFVVRGSLLRHLEDHAAHGVQAQGHAVKTRSTSSTASEFSVSAGVMDSATAASSFLDQISTLSWQDLTSILRLHVVADEAGEGQTAAVAADVWQCPGCLHATQTERDMKEHLEESGQCQEAVILHLAGGLANADELDDEASAEEQLLGEEGNGAVLQLTGSDGGMQYVIVQEDDGSTKRLSEGDKEAHSVQGRDGGMQVLVSMDDSLQHLLQQPAHSDIQIVVEDSTPLKQLFVDSGNEGDQSPNISSVSSSNESQEGVPADTPLLNGSEVLLQIADGRLVLQQTVGGVTQYQLVEGMPAGGEDDAPPELLSAHPSALHTEFILPD